MKRKTRYLSAGMLAMAAINGSAPEAEANIFGDLEKVVRDGGRNVEREIGRAGRNGGREAWRARESFRRSEGGRHTAKAERYFRREWVDYCHYNRGECQEDGPKRGRGSRTRAVDSQKYTAILRVYCEERDNGWDAGYTDLRESSTSSEADAKRTAQNQMRSRNVCADGGFNYRVETGKFEWVHL